MLTRISDGLVKHFCLDCRTPFCAMCSSGHVDHAQIQVRKSDYKDVVLSQDLGLHISVSGIQTYVINAKRIIFVHERPQPRPPKGRKGDSFCKACQRILFDSHAKYCSLQCVLRFEGDAATQRLPFDVKTEPVVERGRHESVSSGSSTEIAEPVGSGGRGMSMEKATSQEGSSSSPPAQKAKGVRKRKGTPLRALRTEMM